MADKVSEEKSKTGIQLEDARILIVDDNPSDRLLIKTILINQGIKNIQEAENVKAGAFKLHNAIGLGTKFDLVILDWNMPGKSGFEFLKEIRAEKATSDTAVIMVTSVTEAEKIRNSLDLGVVDYILKPLKHELLAEKVKKFLSRKVVS